MRLNAAIASVPVVMLALYSGQAHAEPETSPIEFKDGGAVAPINLARAAEAAANSAAGSVKMLNGNAASQKVTKPLHAAVVVTPNKTKLQTKSGVTAAAAGAVKIKTKAVAKAQKIAPPVRRSVRKPRLLASVDLTGQRMTISVDGSVKHVWPISSGRAGYHTPRGTYKPYRMHKMWYSRKYNNAKMPHSVFYRGGFAVHATYATGRLGSPASHGCVRLSPSSARKFYKLVKTYGKSGTTIKITGTTPSSRRSYASRRHKSRRRARRVHRARSYRRAQSGYGQPRRRRAYAARRTYYAARKPKGLLESLFD